MAAEDLPPGPTTPVIAQTAAWMIRPWQFLDRCSARYGDTFTVRLANEGRWVMLSHPDAVKQVFTGPPELLHAGEGNRILLPVLGPKSVLLLDDAPHREQRRVLMPPFRGNHLRSYADVMTDIAAAEMQRWPRGEPIRLLPRMQALTLEIILRTVFGLHEGVRLDELRRSLARLLDLVSGRPGQVLMFTLGPRRLQRLGPLRRLLNGVDELIYAEIEDRRQVSDLSERDDVLSILLRARHENGEPMSRAELRDELMTLLLAGHETTATGLSWAVERVIRHPDVHERLVGEIRAAEHEYRDAVVKETLRLRPVISLVLRRLVEPMEIAGWRLPAGVTVAPSIYLLHRRPEVYPEPERFRPERFVEQKAGTYTWIPFGGGVRRCLGAAFAEFEMRVVLGELFGTYKLRPTQEQAERAKRRSITHVPQRGATVVLA